MKVNLTFKTNDVLDQIDDPKVKEQVEAVADKWIKYGEIITVEIDTEKETCIVLER